MTTPTLKNLGDSCPEKSQPEVTSFLNMWNALEVDFKQFSEDKYKLSIHKSEVSYFRPLVLTILLFKDVYLFKDYS